MKSIKSINTRIRGLQDYYKIVMHNDPITLDHFNRAGLDIEEERTVTKARIDELAWTLEDRSSI